MESSFHIWVKQLLYYPFLKRNLVSRHRQPKALFLGISWDGSRLEWIVRDDTMSSIECATILKFVMHPTVVRNNTFNFLL